MRVDHFEINEARNAFEHALEILGSACWVSLSVEKYVVIIKSFDRKHFFHDRSPWWSVISKSSYYLVPNIRKRGLGFDCDGAMFLPPDAKEFIMW